MMQSARVPSSVIPVRFFQFVAGSPSMRAGVSHVGLGRGAGISDKADSCCCGQSRQVAARGLNSSRVSKPIRAPNTAARDWGNEGASLQGLGFQFAKDLRFLIGTTVAASLVSLRLDRAISMGAHPAAKSVHR